MEQPLVSVICACYNQSRFVVESLESVKNQTYKNIEIIIWDDASKDDSVLVIDNWIKKNPDLKITFTKNVENKGICRSLNEAQSKTTGKYIQLLALDDILLPHKIEHHVAILENSSQHEALVFTDAFIIDDHSKNYQNKFIAYHKKYFSLETGNYFEMLLEGNFIPAMSILYKKEILNKVGSWDESLAFEDYDMLLRLAKNYNFIFDEIPSVKYRIHNTNTHKTLLLEMKKSTFLMFLKYIDQNKRVNEFLTNYLLETFKNNQLTGEQLDYFNAKQAKTWRERYIQENKSVQLYKFREKISKIKAILLYS